MLSRLRESPDCGAQISRRVGVLNTGTKFLGHLYPNLDTLVQKGLVKKGDKDCRANAYTVTKRGQRVLEARRDWERQYVDL